MLHRETLGPFLVQDLVPWYEGEQPTPNFSLLAPNQPNHLVFTIPHPGGAGTPRTGKPWWLISILGAQPLTLLSPPPPAPCRTVKKLLLAGLALLGSAIVAAVLVGSVLAMGLAVWRLRRGQRRRRRPRRQCPFQAELQAVVGALVPRELEKEGEPGSEYHSLEHSSV